MKKFKYIKDFKSNKVGDIFESEETHIIEYAIENGLIEEVQHIPKNRFLITTKDMKVGQKYYYIDDTNNWVLLEWSQSDGDFKRLENNNVFLDFDEIKFKIEQNRATNIFLKCTAKYNNLRNYEPFTKKEYDWNTIFSVFGYNHTVSVDSFRDIQYLPIEYYFHRENALEIREELGDEIIQTILGIKK